MQKKFWTPGKNRTHDALSSKSDALTTALVEMILPWKTGKLHTIMPLTTITWSKMVRAQGGHLGDYIPYYMDKFIWRFWCAHF